MFKVELRTETTQRVIGEILPSKRTKAEADKAAYDFNRFSQDHSWNAVIAYVKSEK